MNFKRVLEHWSWSGWGGVNPVKPQLLYFHKAFSNKIVKMAEIASNSHPMAWAFLPSPSTCSRPGLGPKQQQVKAEASQTQHR